MILIVFSWYKPRFRVIDLHDNEIQDGGALAVAQYVTWYPYGIDELNMSHNNMTAKGVAHITVAFHLHPNKPYPWYNRKLKVYVPAFVRVDENFVKIGADIINCLMTHREELGWTGWTDNSQDIGPQRLKEVSDVRENVPKIAMHLIWQQKRNGPKSQDQEWEEFFEIIEEALKTGKGPEPPDIEPLWKVTRRPPRGPESEDELTSDEDEEDWRGPRDVFGNNLYYGKGKGGKGKGGPDYFYKGKGKGKASFYGYGYGKGFGPPGFDYGYDMGHPGFDYGYNGMYQQPVFTPPPGLHMEEHSPPIHLREDQLPVGSSSSNARLPTNANYSEWVSEGAQPKRLTEDDFPPLGRSKQDKIRQNAGAPDKEFQIKQEDFPPLAGSPSAKPSDPSSSSAQRPSPPHMPPPAPPNVLDGWATGKPADWGDSASREDTGTKALPFMLVAGSQEGFVVNIDQSPDISPAQQPSSMQPHGFGFTPDPRLKIAPYPGSEAPYGYANIGQQPCQPSYCYGAPCDQYGTPPQDYPACQLDQVNLQKK